MHASNVKIGANICFHSRKNESVIKCRATLISTSKLVFYMPTFEEKNRIEKKTEKQFPGFMTCHKLF